jgi:hypothetical protein
MNEFLTVICGKELTLCNFKYDNRNDNIITTKFTKFGMELDLFRKSDANNKYLGNINNIIALSI